MKLPKCPHCQKLLIGMISQSVVLSDDGPSRLEPFIAFLCPERMDHQEPKWVEILEVE